MGCHKLYHHKTDGGAEYLCTQHIAGCDEGDVRHAAVRLDGGPELSPLYAAAPELLRAVHDLLGEYNNSDDPNEEPKLRGDVFSHNCCGCARYFEDLPDGSLCPSDDCPRYLARAAIAKAEGK
jgi:hypothetical protein